MCHRDSSGAFECHAELNQDAQVQSGLCSQESGTCGTSSSHSAKQLAETSLHCVHAGCDQTFSSENDLRQHLHSYSPGLAAEYNYLRQTVISFAGLLNQWDEKTEEERRTSLSHVNGVLASVLSIPPPPCYSCGASTTTGGAAAPQVPTAFHPPPTAAKGQQTGINNYSNSHSSSAFDEEERALLDLLDCCHDEFHLDNCERCHNSNNNQQTSTAPSAAAASVAPLAAVAATAVDLLHELDIENSSSSSSNSVGSTDLDDSEEVGTEGGTSPACAAGAALLSSVITAHDYISSGWVRHTNITSCSAEVDSTTAADCPLLVGQLCSPSLVAKDPSQVFSFAAPPCCKLTSSASLALCGPAGGGGDEELAHKRIKTCY